MANGHFHSCLLAAKKCNTVFEVVEVTIPIQNENDEMIYWSQKVLQKPRPAPKTPGFIATIFLLFFLLPGAEARADTATADRKSNHRRTIMAQVLGITGLQAEPA